MVMTLQIPATIYTELVKHAYQELPNECVGMLLGSPEGLAKLYIPLVNELKSPTRFLTEARSMLLAEKERRRSGWEVLAIVHSHPASEPVPSRYDRTDHYSSEVMCVIVSLQSESPMLKAWWIREGHVESAQVCVDQATA